MALTDGLGDADRDAIVARYADRFREFGIDVRTLNPGSEERHRLQHAVHAAIGDLEGKTVLDIGCGLAHYYAYLKARGTNVNYIGYDIVPPFLEVNRERFPEATFAELDVSRDEITHDADYVVMCQVFNNRYSAASNEAVAKQAITKAFSATRLGLSIDLLSDHVNYREPHLFYFSPEGMFSFAKTLTRFVVLRHDYLPFHFTMYLYREAKAA